MRHKPLPAAPARTASIYVRLSREATDENLSKDGMVEDCLALAERHGLCVDGRIHVDDGISGAVRNRPEFTAWLDDARQLRADTLIAWHVDRMTREGVNVTATIFDALEGKDSDTGKVVRPPVRLLDTKGLDSSGDETAFRFRFVIAAEVARAERERMRDRSRSARRRAVSAGRWPGGPAPFGFRMVDNPNGPGKVLEAVEEEADLIREATARLLAGASFSSVVRFANGPDGHPPRRAKHWWPTTLRQTLTGYPITGRVVRFLAGEAVPILDAEGQPVTIPAILTPDESAAVRRLLLPKPTAPTGGRAPARLLSGLLLCGTCGRRLRVSGRGDRGRVPGRTEESRVYRCSTGKETGTCPRPVSISAGTLDKYVSDKFLATWGESPAYTRRAEVTGAAAVEKAEAKKAAAVEAIAADPSPENLTRLQEANVDLAAALAVPSEAVVRAVPTGRTVRETWSLSELPDQRVLLASNYAAIRVRRGKRSRAIDPDRLVFIAQPPFAVEHQDAADFRPGTVVV